MRNKNPKQKNASDSNDGTLLNIGKKIAWPIFWTIVIIAGLWSLMHFSTPETKLEPYTKFQKTSGIFENNSDSKVNTELERFAETKQSDFSSISTPNPEPKRINYQLPRKTLEHIQKGMQLIEEGKFNSADMEFEKAAQISPDSPEVFAIWGTAVDPRAPALGGWGIGMMVAVDIMMGGGITGAAMNPARWMGTWLFTDMADMSHLLMYWAGPLIGALSCSLLYNNYIMAPEDDDAKLRDHDA